MTAEHYSLTRAPSGEYTIRKFDGDLNLRSQWTMRRGPRGGTYCDCWQGFKGWCRHKEMFPIFEASGHINDGWLYERATGQWSRPTEG